MGFVPELGKLYQFRKDNTNALLKKYKFYYVGLLLCTHEDVTKELTGELSQITYDHFKKNPIYGFEVYNCYQFYDDLDIPVEGIKIFDVLFLTLKEVNDMLEPARAE